MSVKACRIDAGQATMLLREGGEVTFPASVIDRVDPDEVPYPSDEPAVEAAPAAAPVALAAAVVPDAVLAARPFADRIAGSDEAQHVDVRLVHAVIEQGSNYQARARSRKGARGLMQLMPATARQYGVNNAYDPKANKWESAAPLPTARDHTGTLVANGVVHVIGGRVDSFHTNSNLHHTYDDKEDRWRMRNPLPTARSGHGAVLYRNQIFIMGGEGTNRVFGQNEAYDLSTDRWQAYAPMPTPRHGLGAVAIGDYIHVAGGGAVMGGGVQSAVHEAFTLG